MNDERIEKIVREKAGEWRRVNLPEACEECYQACADELESLIPALSEVVSHAHAHAIEAAGKAVCGYCNPANKLNLAGRFNEDGNHLGPGGESYVCRAKLLRSITFPLARIEAELRTAEARLESVEGILEFAPGRLPGRAQEFLDNLRAAVATLRRERDAEKAKGKS